MKRFAHASALIALAALSFGVALPASAEDGAWKVGKGYVIRFDHLDLDQPADRQALLVQVERAAARGCVNAGTSRAREACTTRAMNAALAKSTLSVRQAIAAARLDRDGARLATR